MSGFRLASPSGKDSLVNFLNDAPRFVLMACFRLSDVPDSLDPLAGDGVGADDAVPLGKVNCPRRVSYTPERVPSSMRWAWRARELSGPRKPGPRRAV